MARTLRLWPVVIAVVVGGSGFGQRYTIAKFPDTPPGVRLSTEARAINNKGQMAVWGDGQLPYFFDPGTGFTRIPFFKARTNSQGGTFLLHGLNNNGLVIGDTSDPAWTPTYWSPTLGAGWTNDLLGRFLGNAWGVNDLGQVCGGMYGDGGPITGYLWTPGVGVMEVPKLPGALNGIMQDVNNSGVGCGYAYVSGTYRAFVWSQKDGTRDIGMPLGAEHTEAFGINEQGTVAGDTFSTQGDFAFQWREGVGFEKVQSFRASWTLFKSLNNLGHMVGVTGDPENRSAGWLWRPGMERALRLQDLVVGGTDWSLVEANGMNDKGQICGTAKGPGAVYRMFRLDPVTTPVAATRLDVLAGRVTGGSVLDLGEPDGRALVLAPFLVPNALVPAYDLVVTGSVGVAPLNLWLTCRLKASADGLRCSLQLWDWTAGTWVSPDGWDATVGAEWASLEAICTGEIARFVSGNGEVKARLVANNVSSGAPAVLLVDQLSWSAVHQD